MRRTKIIATLGPATNEAGVLEQLMKAGVDVVRINFSHGSWEERERLLELVRDTSRRCGRYVGLLGDLQGPKIRIQRFRNGSVELSEGQEFTLDAELDPEGGNESGVGVAYEDLVEDVEPGDLLLLADGHIVLRVEAVKGAQIRCRVELGGVLSDNKGINRHGGGLSAPALTDKDRDDLRHAAGLQMDWLAVSFVRSAADVREARAILREAGGEGRIIAKIERGEALSDLEGIIAATDAVMVARGDLGVETGYAGLTGLQKKIIRMTRIRHKVAITATEMMESMIHRQVPTRAEVSDVSNAVMDGTDAVMLSAETAVGEYPVKAVETMAEVCIGAEAYHQSVGRPYHRLDDRFEMVDEAVAMAAMYTANHLDVRAIISLTESGSTALWLSRVRSDIPIYAFTRHEPTRRRVTLYRGVYPVAFDITDADPQQVYREIFNLLLDKGLVKVGELVIFTKGDLKGVSGGTNSMKILQVTSQ